MERALFQVPDLPSHVQVEVNNNCNLSCPMCPRRQLPIPLKEMPIDDFSQIIDRLAAWKMPSVDLGGWGEITCHSRFADMIGIISERKLLFSFTTNGLKMDAGLRKIIRKAAPSALTFSLDSLRPEEADFYGHANHDSYRNMLDFLAEKEAEIPVKVNTLVQKNNSSFLLEMIDELDRAGVFMQVLFSPNIIFETGDQRLKPEDEYALFQLIEKESRSGRWSMIVSTPLGRYQAGVRRYWFRSGRLCPALFGAFYINVEGFVTPCTLKPEIKVGHISEFNSLAELWHHEKFRLFRGCQRDICGSCDAMKYSIPL
jgi:MoaA/NifB/PqqE/SkfB family radical SAM enzyme